MAAASAPKQHNENSETPAAKRMKLSEETVHDSSNLQSFSGFKVVKILNENAQTKTIVIHGKLNFYLKLI